MPGDQATAPLISGVDLLERALSYTFGSLQLVKPQAMTRPTPCAAWDLHALLAHMNDSLAALHEAGGGEIAIDGREYGDPGDDPVTSLRMRGCALLGDWAHLRVADPVSVGGYPVSGPVVATTGAVEITVHGWDVAQACGHPRPIPPALAASLLPLAELLVHDADRPTRFAARVPVSADAGPAQRLLAFLGRSQGH